MVYLGIVLLLSACAPAATPTPADTILGIVWQWVSVTDQATGKTDRVPNPEKYTITFNANGTLNGTADCTTFNGTYSEENGLTLLGASTTAICGAASLDQEYLALLTSVVAGGPDGAGGLALETAGGEQRLLFRNGGVADK